MSEPRPVSCDGEARRAELRPLRCLSVSLWSFLAALRPLLLSLRSFPVSLCPCREELREREEPDWRRLLFFFSFRSLSLLSFGGSILLTIS